jgi:hypothetical protein
VKETLAMIRQAFGEECMRCTRVFEWHSVQGRPKEERQVKRKVKSKLIISLTSRGLFAKNSSWQAKESIPYNTVMFYGECVRTTNATNELAVATRQHIVAQLFSSQVIFDQKQLTLVPHPPYFSLFP